MTFEGLAALAAAAAIGPGTVWALPLALDYNHSRESNEQSEWRFWPRVG